MGSTWKSKVGVGFMLVVVAVGGVGFWKYDQVSSWYQAWRLRSATPEMHNTYAARLEQMGLAGTEALSRMFTLQDETACQNAEQVMTRVLQAWTAKDSRFDMALQQLADQAAGFSVQGQAACLQMLKTLFANNEPTQSASQLILAMLSQPQNSPEARLAVFDLMVAMLASETPAESLQRQAKTWVVAGLRDDSVAVRLAAIRLAVSPGLQLHENLVPLVAAGTTDTAPEVRQLVLLALGEHERLLSTDDLCRFLSDSQEAVRLTAERALKVRGLGQGQIQLAKRMHDSNPMARAEVPGLVLISPDIDLYLWMERLCSDPSPAVRAATARAMAQTKDERLDTLMKKLMDDDRDPTVQQISRFYGASK